MHFKIFYNGNLYPIVCPVPNKVFVYNSLVAFAVGILFGMNIDDIKKGIENFELTEKRSDIFKTSRDITVINDSYNASVDSVLSGLDTLKSIAPKRTVAVLGSMMELGDYSEVLHREVGKAVFNQGVDVLITVGEDAKNIAKCASECGMKSENVYVFSSNNEAIDVLEKVLKDEDTLLIKASNSMHFNEIADYLRNLN